MIGETAQIIKLSAFRKDGTTSATRRALLSPVTVPQTETGKNHRIRQQRYANWRRADAVVGYWNASITMNDAIERVQSAELPEGELHPESVTGTHMVLVGKYRAALMAKLLTPAPTAADITWKRAAFKSGQHVYTDVKPERIERAIADDVEFLKAHPTRRSGKQGMDPEKLQKRHAWKAAFRARVTLYAEQNGIDKSELAWLGRIKHQDLAAFADRHRLSLDWLLTGEGTPPN
jgi:hypothetical protein